MPVSKKIVFLFIPAVFFLFIIYSRLPTVYADPNTACLIQNPSPSPRVIDGLISALDISNNFGSNNGKCIKDNKAAFAPYKIPTYEDLKSIYYTQAKSDSTKFTKNIQLNGNFNVPSIMVGNGKPDIFLVTGNLTKLTGEGFGNNSHIKQSPAVIFVEEDFIIDSNISYGGGFVFIVKGNVIIHPDVSLIKAVIISSGKIYTAGNNCTNVQTANPLVIEGSLISIYKDQPQADFCALNPTSSGCPSIKFCRTLANNNNPAEQINWQPKYLVILKDLFASTLEKWSEIEE